MDINHTRSMVRAALSGALDDVPMVKDPNFDLMVPTSCPDVPAEVLQPRETWADKDAYDRQAAQLQAMFEENHRSYASGHSDDEADAG
jgi:phosphoenolpyruvate carboxykinase (ATP)